MSTSLLYHGWGIRDYKYLSTRYEKGQVIFVVEPNPDHLQCPVCKGSDWVFNGFRWRTLHGLPIGNRRVLIETKIPKLQCHQCDCITEIDPPFAEPYRTYIAALEQYAIELCRITTIKGASQISGLSWHVVKNIDKRYLKKKYSKISIKDIRHIAIDEFAVRKGHRYMTDIVDLQTGRILYVANGKDSTAIIPFLKRFKRRNSMALEAIAIDMSVPFTCAVRDTLPGVPLVYDHFHIMQKMNEQLDALRRRLMHTMHEDQKRFIKGIRYLILMGDKKLEETDRNKPGSKQRLEQALAINEPLNMAYYLKEKLRLLWDQTNWNQGQTFLNEWCIEAVSTEIPELQKMAATLREHYDGILNYFHYQISTGPLEGLHNKIKTLKRESYGFRDEEYFKLRLLALHESHYALLRI